MQAQVNQVVWFTMVSPQVTIWEVGMNNLKANKMKTLKYIFATLFLVALVGCNKNYIPESEKSNVETMVISESETKTSYNNGVVSWTIGDYLMIFDNLGGRNLFTNSSDAASTFEGNVTTGTTKFWGVYPDKLVLSTSSTDGNVRVTLPSNQTPAAGTFAEEHNISVTTANKTPGNPNVDGVTFHNVCGLVSFKVPSRIAAKKVIFTSTNTNIAGTLSVNCETSAASIIENGSKTITMEGSFSAGSTFYLIVAPGTINGFRVDVETTAGSLYYKSAGTGSLAVEAGKCINLGEIDFKNGVASAVAEHTYETGVLTGTSLTVNHGIPSNMWSDVTALNVTVKKGGTTYRTYTASVVNNATIIPSGNHYLPQGTYTVTGIYTTNGVDSQFTTTFSTSAPSFTGTANVGASTSYSLYSAGNVAAANNHGAEVISSPNASFGGISANVLAECPVSYEFSVAGQTKTGTTSATNFTHFENFTGLSWGSHTLNCSITFDGVTINGSTTCRITGLPYKANVMGTNNSASSLWTQSNTSQTNDLMRFHTTSASIVSPKFSIPSTVNIAIESTANAYSSLAGQYGKPKIFFKVSSTPTQTGAVEKALNGNIRVDSDFDSQYDTININTFVFDSTNSQLSILSSQESAWGQTRRIRMKKLYILYR